MTNLNKKAFLSKKFIYQVLLLLIGFTHSQVAMALPISVTFMKNDDGKKVVLIGDVHIDSEDDLRSPLCSDLGSNQVNHINHLNENLSNVFAELRNDGNGGSLVGEYAPNFHQYMESCIAGNQGEFTPSTSFIVKTLFNQYQLDPNKTDVLCGDQIRGHEDFLRVINKAPLITKTPANAHEIESYTNVNVNKQYREHVQQILDKYKQKILNLPEKEKDALLQVFSIYEHSFLDYDTNVHSIFTHGPNIEAVVNVFHLLYGGSKNSAIVYFGDGHILGIKESLKQLGFKTEEKVRYSTHTEALTSENVSNLTRALQDIPKYIDRSTSGKSSAGDEDIDWIEL